ncbi:FKBP-type peptidyl-prolyl cis-trans isomerase [Hyunsoonleella pacifica]|uniref:peptidylprolyl isomerase n=1 Tax=Hyunsoonleella pacifica TaxID=1080224 RepID=A0A4V2JAK4_9FLAO|nr:hypothetical protein [Hyunsoonleella pacifica]TBN13006.1 hypothetical protein EYD46_16000 [Hyunsoonleella pacifica]GGD27931.1 hypothetical protein GCM10011368_32420 [Hyunsoonleella pacifica]
MSLRKIGFIISTITLVLVGCKSDDDSTEIPEVVIRDRGEQQTTDDAALIEYLSTHYYNAGDFDGNSNSGIADLIISEVPSSGVLPNATDRLLYTDDGDENNDAVQIVTTTFAETEYKYYLLELNKGGGATSPNFSDRIRVVYQGFLLDGSVFDSAVTPVDLNLIGDGTNTFGTITGWRKVFPLFNVAESFVDNGDGTVSYTNAGTGVMFLPSGLAYFASPPSIDIPAYSPLIFEFELLQSFVTDHDNDGIPSYLEKFLNEGEFADQFVVFQEEGQLDDDTDSNNFPNYVDTDDDGDGILTQDEIVVREVIGDSEEELNNTPLNNNEMLVSINYDVATQKYIGIIIDFIDTDNDNTPDYLDAD